MLAHGAGEARTGCLEQLSPLVRVELKIGLVNANYSFGAAVDLFNGVLNLVLIVSANLLSRRLTEISLW